MTGFGSGKKGSDPIGFGCATLLPRISSGLMLRNKLKVSFALILPLLFQKDSLIH
jgi:hypothetical protein